jgi:hypothetical protein
MLAIDMPRKDTKLRLDDRVLAALRQKADETDLSFNALCEAILFNYAKSVGKLPLDAEPLGDPRGGSRKNAGRPKKGDEPKGKTDVPAIAAIADPTEEDHNPGTPSL